MTDIINKENCSKESLPPNNNEFTNINQKRYDNANLEIEQNSINNSNKPNSPLTENFNTDFYSINALKKLDMVHPTNNYYNNKIELPNTYKVFIRPDTKHDFGNYLHFNDHVDFDPKKYQRPEIYFGYVHDQYLMPHILYGKTKNDKIKEDEENEKNNEKNKKDGKIKESDKNKKTDSKKVKAGTSKKSKVNTIKSLDDIMNKYNLKYIEPPPKEKKVEPPPEEVPPEEEEENKDNKDKNKAKKESANKSKKDDKTKNAKPTKK